MIYVRGSHRFYTTAALRFAPAFEVYTDCSYMYQIGQVSAREARHPYSVAYDRRRWIEKIPCLPMHAQKQQDQVLILTGTIG